MRVTSCEMPDAPEDFERSWKALAEHVAGEGSELVLLPEMPFHPWFARTPHFNSKVWQAAVSAHDAWEKRLVELAPAVVAATRPVDFGNERYNSGFLWSATHGVRAVHAKAYLPNEEGVWEASWYSRAVPEFVPVQEGPAEIGFAICSELWAMERAREYGSENVNLLLTPRLTEEATFDKWLAAGRVAAILAGAFGLSSNRRDDAAGYGGCGWIVSPDGEVMGLTSRENPFVTVDVDLDAAKRARSTYPRYVLGQPERPPVLRA